MGRLTGKVALITGAGTGQGEAEARLLAAEGAKVIATDINLETVSRVVDEINAAQPNVAMAVRHDVASGDEWAHVVASGKKAFGPITILVNNAGILAPASYDKVTYDHWRRTMDVNAWSQFVGMQSVIPQMKQAGVGSIVNIASLAVVNACGRFTAYTASKGAVDAVSRAAAIELAPLNIRVNSINPGVIHTAMVDEAFPTRHQSMPPRQPSLCVAWGGPSMSLISFFISRATKLGSRLARHRSLMAGCRCRGG